MKNVIYTFYNILISDINKDNNNYYFYFNSDLYLFYLIENDINKLDKILKYIEINNIDMYQIIKNKDNNYFVKVENNYYALLKIKGIYKYEIKCNELKYYPIKDLPNNWGKLWEERLDYYEVQIRELGFNHDNLLNTFGYFKGICENAILYYNLTIDKFKENIKVGIVHNRINYPCYEIDYKNPLNLVIDYNIRDISEYLKSYAMSSDFKIENIITFLNNIEFNNLMFNLMYSRILYPSFYFDTFDRIILNNADEKKLFSILKHINNYIDMLKILYNNYHNKYQMFNITWLNN